VGINVLITHLNPFLKSGKTQTRTQSTQIFLVKAGMIWADTRGHEFYCHAYSFLVVKVLKLLTTLLIFFLVEDLISF
jgi:hypothetical protein